MIATKVVDRCAWAIFRTTLLLGTFVWIPSYERRYPRSKESVTANGFRDYFGFRVDSGFRVYAGAFYAAQRRHPAASRREKTLNPKPNTNHSLAWDPKVRARLVASRATARASRVVFEKTWPTKNGVAVFYASPQNPFAVVRKTF